MRLVNEFHLSAWERQHAYCGEDAVDHVRQALHDRHPIEGLEELRSGLMIDVDSEVLDQIERASGGWSGLKPTTVTGRFRSGPLTARSWS